MVDIPGPVLDDDTAEHLRRHRVRAVCLFRRNIESETQLVRLTTALREVLGEEALIAIDQEGGCVIRTGFLPFPPSAMSLGASDDPTLARQVGAATGRALTALGINWNFAPVLDLNVNPRNPVIGDRAFGADPQRATDLALAWLRGSLDARVAGCVKHFPGHGDTALDSHHALPTVDKPRTVLDTGELLPFARALREAEVPAVMTAHIVYPALDPDRPATLSRPILTGLLREEWGYEGVVITDSMGMQAIDANYGRGEAAVMALEAGADMVMALGRRSVQEATLEAVEAALSAGRVNPAASLERLSRLARTYPSTAGSYPRETRTRDAALMHDAWARGLTAYRDPQAPARGRRVTLVAREGVPGENVTESGVDGAALASLLGDLYDVRTVLTDDPASLDWEDLREGGERLVIFASTSRHRDPALRGLRPDLHLALWNPYAVLDVDAPALISYGYRRGALNAVARWLAGELRARGTLPVPLVEVG
jgi:beta-N-acetylhexosaminidase